MVLHGPAGRGTIDKKNMHKIAQGYKSFASAASCLQSPLLLAIRLYWGWQFIQTGWGKLHRLPQVADFFASLHVPFPALSAHFISGLELVGGSLLILGLASRLVGLLLACNMCVAYLTADRTALHAIFSDPGTFYNADPFTFLFASLLVFIFGAGLFSLDAWIARQYRGQIDTE